MLVDCALNGGVDEDGVGDAVGGGDGVFDIGLGLDGVKVAIRGDGGLDRSLAAGVGDVLGDDGAGGEGGGSEAVENGRGAHVDGFWGLSGRLGLCAEAWWSEDD